MEGYYRELGKYDVLWTLLCLHFISLINTVISHSKVSGYQFGLYFHILDQLLLQRERKKRGACDSGIAPEHHIASSREPQFGRVEVLYSRSAHR